MGSLPNVCSRSRVASEPIQGLGHAVRVARVVGALGLLLAGSAALTPSRVAAEAPGIATGDLPAIQKTGALRLLVTAPEYLQRAGDPKREELALAVAFARKLDLRPVSIV